MLIVLFYKLIGFFTVQSITEKPLLSVKWNLLKGKQKDTDVCLHFFSWKTFYFYVLIAVTALLIVLLQTKDANLPWWKQMKGLFDVI